jgi:hypothetical protein
MALDVASIHAAFTNPTRLKLNEIDSNQFAIVCVPIYGYLAIVNDKYEFVDMAGTKTSIDGSARSLGVFLRINEEKQTGLVELLLLEYNCVRDKSRWHIIQQGSYYSLTPRVIKLY